MEKIEILKIKLEQKKQKKEMLEKEWSSVTKAISLSQMKRKIVISYNNYKYNNSYVYGLFLFTIMFFSFKEMLHIPFLESSIISVFSAGSVSITADVLLKKKAKKIKNKYKDDYPEISGIDIDFDNFNFEDSYSVEDKLSHKLNKLCADIEQVKSECNYFYKILLNADVKDNSLLFDKNEVDLNKQDDKGKVKVMTLVRRK